MRRKKTTDRYAEEKRRIFSFDVKESEDIITETEREFQIIDPMYLKALSPRSFCPSLEHEISEYLRLNEESEKESRDDATQRSMEELYPRQCGSK